MKIDPHIFRAYDIRGRAHAQLSTDACRLIGQAFGSLLREISKKDHPNVVVGRDARTHGPELERGVVEGLMAAGCHVLLMGPTPSPVNYFMICEKKLEGGVQVTASHNPKEDNGLKLQIHDAEAFSGDDLQKLRQRIERGDLLTGKGSSEEIDAVTPYITHISKMFAGIGKNLHIAVDAGNGIAGPVNCDVLRKIGCTVEELYTEPDGTFPNHAADPSKYETLKELQVLVKKKKLAAGLAFDGDGDRLGLVDETGAVRSADDILLLLAKDHLSRHPGAIIVFTVSNSGTLITEIAKWGGRPVMCKVGHSFVEHTMREEDSLLGGEQSGHFFCGEDFYPYDDALVAALRVLQILSRSGKPLSSLFADFPKTFQAPERRPFCPDDKKGEIVAAVTKHFEKSYPVNTLDGARIDFGDGGWAGIRQSNTSPCLSICIEARSEDRLKQVEEIVLSEIKKYVEV
ncbi:phosphomannomutase/phosphoglucomutase [Candidatus Peregrinibacteria bacterium]|nr:phosphomannomutase/phosphoglucomutase [Candidatus Peregrinibacteria bacterium]